jgi:hypothetical protein
MPRAAMPTPPPGAALDAERFGKNSGGSPKKSIFMLLQLSGLTRTFARMQASSLGGFKQVQTAGQHGLRNPVAAPVPAGGPSYCKTDKPKTRGNPK